MIGNKYKGEPIDVWSSGITLYNMVCGLVPFWDDNDEILYKKITECKYSIPTYISDGAKDLIKRILVSDPEKRYKIEDIKRHPWFGIVYPSRCVDGLMINTHIMPIEESIIGKMKDEYDFNPEEIRLGILANKHSNITTTYYLLLKKFVDEGNKSCADMWSNLYKDYLGNHKNLLNNYNHDINIIIRERCIKPPTEEEDIRLIPIVLDIKSNLNNKKEHKIYPEKSSNINKKSVAFNNSIEIITSKGNIMYDFLVKEDEKSMVLVTRKLSSKNNKEKYLTLNDLNNEDNFKTKTNILKQNNFDSINYLQNSFDIKNLNIKKRLSFLETTKNKAPMDCSYKTNEVLNNKLDEELMKNNYLRSDKDLKVKINIKSESNLNILVENSCEDLNNNTLSRVYPKNKDNDNISTVENHILNEKNFNYTNNFLDTSMSNDFNNDSCKIQDPSIDNSYNSKNIEKQRVVSSFNNHYTNSEKDKSIINNNNLKTIELNKSLEKQTYYTNDNNNNNNNKNFEKKIVKTKNTSISSRISYVPKISIENKTNLNKEKSNRNYKIIQSNVCKNNINNNLNYSKSIISNNLKNNCNIAYVKKQSNNTRSKINNNKLNDTVNSVNNNDSLNTLKKIVNTQTTSDFNNKKAKHTSVNFNTIENTDNIKKNKINTNNSKSNSKLIKLNTYFSSKTNKDQKKETTNNKNITNANCKINNFLVLSDKKIKPTSNQIYKINTTSMFKLNKLKLINTIFLKQLLTNL